MTGWYADFLSSFVLPNAAAWSYAVTFGEILVGLELIVGCLTGIAAFFGSFMSANFLFAGTVSINPLLFVLATWLVLAWRVAGYYGLDFFVPPVLGTRGRRASSSIAAPRARWSQCPPAVAPGSTCAIPAQALHVRLAAPDPSVPRPVDVWLDHLEVIP